jgi:tetratricopeptide (TPR) repeat protein
MKNKIVKALVLASIVSMTATGAAGLTFADENVATGDTATSTTDTATKKTVDELEADLTAAQKAADKKNEDFTEKLAAYTEAAKPVTVKTDTELKKVVDDSKAAVTKTIGDDETKGTLIYTIRDAENYLRRFDTNGIDSKEKEAQVRAYFNQIDGGVMDPECARGKLQAASIAYYGAVNTFINDLFDGTTKKFTKKTDPGYTTAETHYKEIETAKKAYDEAKKACVTAYGKVSDVLDEDDYLKIALPKEDAAITAYEGALEELVGAGKAVLDSVTAASDREAALEKAKTELKTATEAYKKALTDLGTAKSAYEEATADLVQIYRLYHPATHEHLWTKDANEKKVLSTERGWIYEGVAWLTKKKGTDAVPLYRLVYPFSGDHHYTTSENEVKDLTTKYGWISEDVAFYVPKEGDVPVYRLFNPGLKMGAHHFTTGENEYNTLGERGWTKENVAYKVSAKGALDTSEIKTEDSRIAEAEKVYAN